MRNFLVKNFVLDYKFTIFGTTFNAPRASRIIFPIFMLTGWLCASNPNYPTPDITLWVMYIMTAVSLYFGFIHFRIYKVTFSELDEFQKYQYGIFKPNELTQLEYKEWIAIFIKLTKKL
jgi:hypothetical protein